MTLEVQTRSAAAAMDRNLPLQTQIFAELRAELLDGLWIGRNHFYTEKELGQHFNVSSITARAVLDRLAEEGWISRTRGRRSRAVRGPAGRVTDAGIPIVTASEQASFSYQVCWMETRVAPAEACHLFDLPAGSQLWQCLRLRRLNGQVHSVSLNAQLPAVGERHDFDALHRKSMVSILADEGIAVAVLNRRVSAVSAPVSVAMLLGVKMGVSTLLYTCELKRSDGSTIEWLRIYLHPDQRPDWESFDMKEGTWISLNRP